MSNLNCANCAAKIERKSQDVDGVVSSRLNFMSKKLILDIENKGVRESVIKNTLTLIEKTEPGTKCEVLDSTEKVTIYMSNLNCANCASKIERQSKNITGVVDTTLDFMSKKLVLNIENKSMKESVIKDALALIEKIEPGTKCEVLDESKKSSIKEGEQKSVWIENRTNLIRLGVGAALFFIGMVFNFSDLVEGILFLVSYLLVGGDVLLKAGKNIIRGKVFDENFLMAIATLGAFAIKQYPEGVAVMLFYQVGELFQDMAVDSSRRSIKSLMNIRPDYANVKNGEDIKKVSPEDVNIGDIIVIKPGEKVPLDGVVLEGKSMLDTSALTGESVPRSASVGDEILGGTINKNGLLTVKVTKSFSESTVAKILDLMENASGKKAQTENFITKFAKYYTPIVVILAAALAFIPPFVSDITFSSSIYRALVFLVVSCPCALVVSIPLGFFGGIGGASKKGILVKGGNYLEALNNVETVVFDKTGTLTKGTFNVTKTNIQDDFNEEYLMEYAVAAESFSSHPIALSIIKTYGKEIDKASLKDYEEIPGHGLKVSYKGKTVLAGNKKLMDRENVDCIEEEAIGTVVYVAVDNAYIGNIIISDEIKEDSKNAINELKKVGVKKAVMLTGDNKKVAEGIAKLMNIDEVHSELLPHEKVEKLEKLENEKSKNGKVVFVGDGINDAPVLARADIGIAMGGVGSDAAIEAADVIIMTDEPSKIVSAIKIAKRTRRIVIQNIVFAIGVKVIILIFGALGMANMWEAVFGDVGVALIAVLNAMRALKVNKL
ncbi:MAG: heavy metal translocating P-type ATPase [Clostridium perfringens]|nr:heavy metal translocating P-type ATPase [Clostridium perfringens]